MPRHLAIDSRGQVHRRQSQNRTYAFAIVTHHPAREAGSGYRAIPAYSHVEWASRRDLAEAVARRYSHVEVEIIAAVVVSPKADLPKGGHQIPAGSVQCPHCRWGFAPYVIAQHIREKHPLEAL